MERRAERPMLQRVRTRVADTLFSMLVERVISWARVVLATVSLLAVLFDPTLPGSTAFATKLLLSLYLAYAGGLLLATTDRQLTDAERPLVHAFDFMVSASLMFMADSATSPFFVFFVFVLLAAGLRWNWIGVVATAGGLVAVLVLLVITGWVGSEDAFATEYGLTRTAIRAAIILACAIMVAYFGAFRERSRNRFARLAAWPPPAEEPVPFTNALEHASSILRVPRLFLLWDDSHEPFRNVVSWDERGVEATVERPDTFGRLPTAVVASGPAPTARASSSLDPDFIRFIRARAWLAAPFQGESCHGCVVFIDRPSWAEDDVKVAEMISARIGMEIENRRLREKLRETAVEEERGRLARDLHDGVLQGLAAATMHLRLDGVPPELDSKLKMVRSLLVEEAARVRSFVDGVRVKPPKGAIVDLSHELDGRIRKLRDQWQCNITFDAVDGKVLLPASTAIALRHVVAEAVSNAVRHGGATRIEVGLNLADGRVQLQIKDNGSGFDNLSGSFSFEDLAATGAGPLSICSRVDDLGGKFLLTSSETGADIRVELAL
jgi:signal transduction histidine kinase